MKFRFGKPAAIVLIIFVGTVLVGSVILVSNYFLLSTSLQFEIIEITPYKASFNICKSFSWSDIFIYLLFHQHQPELVVLDKLLFITYYNEKILATTEFYNVYVSKKPHLLSAHNTVQEDQHKKTSSLPILRNLPKNFTPAALFFSNPFYPQGIHKSTTDFISSQINENDMFFIAKVETRIFGVMPISLEKKFSFSEPNIITCK